MDEESSGGKIGRKECTNCTNEAARKMKDEKMERTKKRFALHKNFTLPRSLSHHHLTVGTYSLGNLLVV